ncbi:N-acetylneuraminate lyase-like [Trichogramma pretiosum]|uniref:N-acetylneuraminate lyase-like n=1 Tax=Trichogramma pretiosum TaxID=7493 RepID=UPI0006C9A182|nr:N-acetylneuraminate lyase-like [Trichogramma pretiosum]
MLRPTTLFIVLATSQFAAGVNLRYKDSKFDLKGLVAPVFTPFLDDENRSLNLKIIPDYAEFLASKNISAVLVAGSTGEGTLLSVEERKKLAEAWSRAGRTNKLRLMIHVGGVAPIDVQNLAAHAESIGADSILCLPDLYLKPKSTEDLIEYLDGVSKAAPRTPLIYYQSSKVPNNVRPYDLLTLGGKRISTLAGIKIDSSDIKDGLEALRANENTGKNYTIIYGSKMPILPACGLGVETFMTASLNFVPEAAFEIIEFCGGRSDLEAGRAAQKRLSQMERDVLQYGGYVEAMKTATSLASGLYLGPPRAPFRSLSLTAAEKMSKDLARRGLSTEPSTLRNYKNL